MKTFLLYGSGPCVIYRNEGFDELLKHVSNKSNSFGVGDIDVFDTEKIDILNTLTNFSGWGDVMEISEAEYNILIKYWW